MKGVALAALALILTAAGCSRKEENMPERYSLIPKPAELVMARGSFIIDNKTELKVSPLNHQTKSVAEFLAGIIRNSASVPLPVSEGSKDSGNSIVLVIDTAVSENSGGYILSVTGRSIFLKSP